MKTIILCGGKGTRIGDLTQNRVPKPMVQIGDRPIVEHIMRCYAAFGYEDFILCLGHLGWSIKEYFLTLQQRHSTLIIDFKSGQTSLSSCDLDLPSWRVSLLETGTETMTAGRIKRALSLVGGDKHFMVTYGDGLSDLNIGDLIAFHLSHGKGVTITGVEPPGRFGEMNLQGEIIKEWSEKPQQTSRYINGGFMVFSTDYANALLNNYDDNDMLEREPFEEAAKSGEMMLFRHHGFWQCMDTARDWELLDTMWAANEAPWVK